MKISVITPTIRPAGLQPIRESLMEQTFPVKDFEWLVDINITGKHDLNAAFNRLIKRSSGELIVFYEDWTKIQPNGLELFWDAYQGNPNTLFTAPLGKVDNWGDKPRWDWRNHQLDIECSWNNCELDWGAIPKDILYKIGGFDERLDQWWSMDNVSIGKRALLLGYKFKNLKSNPAVAIDHDKKEAHPFRQFYNPVEVNAIMAEYDSNPSLNYL